MSYYKMAAVQRRKYLLMASCLVLIGLSGWLAANGWLDRFDEWLLGPLFTANDAFLQEAGQRARSMTVLLAELHAGCYKAVILASVLSSRPIYNWVTVFPN